MVRRCAPLLLALVGCSGGSQGSAGPASSDGGGADGTMDAASDGGGLGADGAGDATGSTGADGGDSGTDGASSGPLPDYASGTRLRAKVYRTPDGTKLWHGWYDSKIADACAFAAAEDGVMRCLPIDAYSGYYADAQCTTPIEVVAPFSCPPVPAYVGVSSAACSTAIYQVGAKVGAVTSAYQHSGPSCVTASVMGDEYALTHLAATSLVAATEIQDPRTSMLAARYLRADDGALQPLGAYDRTRSAACAPLTLAYANSCSPTDLVFAYAGQYSDAQCTSILARKFDAACLGPRQTVEVQTADACYRPSVALNTLGSPIQGPIYGSQGGVCSVTSTPAGYTDYALGAGIPASSLPAVATADVGAGRIVTRYRTAGTGEKLLPVTWVDTQLGDVCTVQGTANGLRCLPGFGAMEGYSDASCANAAVYVSHPAGCPSLPVPKYVTWYGSGACGANASNRLLQVGAVVSAVGLYVKGPTCGVSALDPHGLDFYAASEIDTSTLPAITDVTE